MRRGYPLRGTELHSTGRALMRSGVRGIAEERGEDGAGARWDGDAGAVQVMPDASISEGIIMRWMSDLPRPAISLEKNPWTWEVSD